ncbi:MULTISPECIES: tetratricopeptide repeat protein [unclassified Wenzhouxiangella]|uniref:tetratricopeptide repeat protein n=1 Tax=unclassified Wenzhouxiangella TaxID=2613841 RepID=UPI0015F25419|nr:MULTISPECIES: tetratricopeptide repeat protein [unclassified Wenzhouxiangella]
MDKRTIFLPAARQIKQTLLAGGLCLWLGACATSGQGGDDPAGTQNEQAESEAMLHITTAERLADVGEYESALEEYLAAARISNDPEIARMVTRLAGQLENWPAAAAAAERWLELDEDADSAHHVHIIARINLGQPEEAVDAMTNWLDRDSSAESARWWRRAAMLLAATSDDGTAREAFEQLVDERGDMAPAGEVAHAESILLWRQGEQALALERSRLAAESSSDVEHLVWAAQLAADTDDLEQALDLYERARERDPDDVSLALSQAEVLRQLERDEQALDLLRSLSADSEVLYTLGIYLARLDRDSEADAVWQRMRDLPEAAQRSGHAYLVAQFAELVGRDEAALEWYERVDDPARQEESMLRRAAILGRMGRVEAGRSILAELREQGDDELVLDTWLIEAEMLRSNGRAAEAVELLAEPLAENRGSTELLYARALSAATAGNVDLAEQDLRRIIQMDGDNAMALNALGYTLTDLTDRHQEAYRLIQRALELDPEDPATLDSMGWVLYRLGRAEEAVDYLQRALEGDENPEIMAHLIEVLDHLGKDDEAAELIERALADYPDDDYLRNTLERLGRLP